MRSVILSFFLLAALAGVALITPARATTQTSTCPDGFFLVPAVYSPNQDKNGNGLICRKIEDGTIVGGPDDKFRDDIII